MEQAAVTIARELIAGNGVRVARAIVNSRGIDTLGTEAPEAKAKILGTAAGLFLEEKDAAAAAACFLLLRELGPAFAENIDANAAPLAQVLSRMADDLFYDRGDSERAADLLMLAAALDRSSPQIPWDAIAPLIQGSRMRAREALPYAIIAAELNPERNEVDYILGLVMASQVSDPTPPVSPDGTNWVTAGGNGGRTGSGPGPAPLPLEIAWKFEEAGFIQGGIAVSDGIAVFGDRNGVLFALTVLEGKKLWEAKLGGVMTGTPAISENRVFVGRGNRARCFDLRTGNPVWMWDKPDRGPRDILDLFSGNNTILVLGDLVIFSDDNFTILESETGKALYVKNMAYDGWAHTGACHDENTIFLPSGHRLYTLPLRSRSAPGSIVAEGKITAGPVAFRGKIIYGNNRSEIVAHEADSGKQIWSFPMEGQVRHTLDIIITSRPAGWEDRVIFGGGDGCCYALAADTGQKIWKADTGQALISPPIVVGDTVFILSEQAKLFAMNAHDGTVLWHATTGDVGELSNEMAFSEGLLLVGSMGVSAWRSRK